MIGQCRQIMAAPKWAASRVLDARRHVNHVVRNARRDIMRDRTHPRDHVSFECSQLRQERSTERCSFAAEGQGGTGDGGIDELPGGVVAGIVDGFGQFVGCTAERAQWIRRAQRARWIGQRMRGVVYDQLFPGAGDSWVALTAVPVRFSMVFSV